MADESGRFERVVHYDYAPHVVKLAEVAPDITLDGAETLETALAMVDRDGAVHVFVLTDERAAILVQGLTGVVLPGPLRAGASVNGEPRQRVGPIDLPRG